MRPSNSWIILLTVCISPACGSLDVDLDAEREPGRRVAVLPLQGEAPRADLDVLRSMIRAQLEVRNIAVLDSTWVDHQLSREGYLVDPARANFPVSRLAEIANVLDVDGVVVGREFSYERLDLLVAYRRGLGGDLTWYGNDARPYWRARYTAERRGGVAIESGQVINALRDTLDSSGSRELVRLAVDWMDAVFAELPEFPAEEVIREREPSIDEVYVTRGDEGRTLEVVSRGSSGALARFDSGPGTRGVPMLETAPGTYRGVFLPSATRELEPIVVHVVDRWGRSASREAGTKTGGER